MTQTKQQCYLGVVHWVLWFGVFIFGVACIALARIRRPKGWEAVVVVAAGLLILSTSQLALALFLAVFAKDLQAGD